MGVNNKLVTLITALSCWAICVPASAVVLLDYSPQSYPTATPRPNDSGGWSNTRQSFHYADSFILGVDASLTGMDIWSDENFGIQGDVASFQVWQDNGANSIGTLLYDFTDPISIIDTESVVAPFLVNRKHVDFTAPVALMGGVKYWISMSGLASEIALLGLAGAGAPDDGASIRFMGDDTSDGGIPNVSYGDVSMRLHGEISQVPEPTTLALMGLGLAGIGYRRRKIRKA